MKREAEEYKYTLYLRDEEEEENIEDLRFALDKNMDFRKAFALDDSKQSAFIWRDLRFGDNNKTEYEFVIPEDVSDATIQLFHLTHAQSLYQAIYRRPIDGVLEHELLELVKDETITSEEATQKPSSGIDGRIVFKSEVVGLYVFDSVTGLFVSREAAVNAIISEPSLKQKGSFECIEFT